MLKKTEGVLERHCVLVSVIKGFVFVFEIGLNIMGDSSVQK